MNKIFIENIPLRAVNHGRRADGDKDGGSGSRKERSGRGHARLWATCFLMVVVSLITLAYSMLYEDETTVVLDSNLPYVVMGTILSGVALVLFIVCLVRAFRVVRLAEEDTHDYVSLSQQLVIAMCGIVAVEWCITWLLAGNIYVQEIVLFVLMAVACLLYYKAMGREGHSQFWTGIRVEEANVAAPSDIPLPLNLHLNDSGMLVAARDKSVDVRVVDHAEFAASATGDDAAYVVRLAAGQARTEVFPFNGGMVGIICVPKEKFTLSGLPIDGDIQLSYVFDANGLSLIADDELARRFVSWYLTEQYQHKSKPAEVVLELKDLLIGRDATALKDLENRIALLGGGLSESVTEIPADFLDFVTDTRHDLGALAAFYRQLSSTSEAALADNAKATQRERDRLVALARRADSLAEEAQGLSSFVEEMREQYQSRIDIRQNSVMSILTIVTSIATPIALISGWYGMNFAGMSELGYDNAYALLGIAVVVIVTAEIFYFKRKRWF